MSTESSRGKRSLGCFPPPIGLPETSSPFTLHDQVQPVTCGKQATSGAEQGLLRLRSQPSAPRSFRRHYRTPLNATDYLRERNQRSPHRVWNVATRKYGRAEVHQGKLPLVTLLLITTPIIYCATLNTGRSLPYFLKPCLPVL